MSNYASPFRVRLLRAARSWVNVVLQLIRSPFCRPRVLLATGNATPAKIAEIESRLRFLFSHFDEGLEIRRAPTPPLLTYIRETAIVAADAKAVPKVARKHLAWVADLDFDTNPIDGWALMYLGEALSRDTRGDAAKIAMRTFVEHVKKLRSIGPRPAYIFGTGPSLRLAGERSFADGITVVCNTIVRDPQLWSHLAPDILTAGDAIYHFGHTPHARAFRRDALERLRESGGSTLFVYPAMFDVVVRHEFKDVEQLLVPIPWGDHTDLAVDLTQTFALPRLDNVLNNALLPLGCTLSKDVRLWGFDGRGPNDDGFWANSSLHAYPELMQSIRDAHPAFFDNSVPAGNETKYVKQVHGDLLDQRLAEAERRGFRFRMLHNSWTPTLQKRHVEE